MLTKPNRLRKYYDFSRVYQRGERRRSSNLVICFCPRTSGSNQSSRASQQQSFPSQRQPTRIGITISQKVSKRAVVRNRIKRQVRAACRELLPQMALGWDIVVIVRAEAVQCDYHQFLQQLKQLFTKVELLHGD